MPWPSSINSNPSSCLISRNIASPVVWRPEFQQVENEIILPNESRERDHFGNRTGERSRASIHTRANPDQDQSCSQSVTDRRDDQGGTHSNYVRQAGHAETRNRHQAEETQSHDRGNPTAQMRWRAFLDDRIRQAKDE